MQMTTSGTYTEAALNKLTKPELVQLLLKTEATLGSQITYLSWESKDNLIYLKQLQADIAVIKTVNDRLVERVVKKERQCSLIVIYITIFIIIFFLPLLQGSATTWQNTNLKINFIIFLFILLSVKFFNNV